MGPTILECRRLRNTPEQGRCGSDVLACPGEVWEGFIVLDDPLVHIMSHGACTPTISVTLDLALELNAFLLELESRFLKLQVLGLQLLHPQARWGSCIPLDLVIEVVGRGSLLVDALDMPFEGTCHETFTRGVMAPPTGVRARERLWLLYEEVIERFCDVFDHPHELVARGG